jgi:hypothetical protein
MCRNIKSGESCGRKASICSAAAAGASSTDPEFVPKAADIVGLHLAPPENAVILCVDEKPHIQALERAQGYLKLPLNYQHGAPAREPTCDHSAEQWHRR